MAKKKVAAQVKPEPINQEELLEHIRAYKSAKSAIEDLEKQVDENKKAIIAVMNAHKLTEMTIDVFKISYKEVAKTMLDGKSIKAELPDLYERYTYQSVSNVLSIR